MFKKETTKRYVCLICPKCCELETDGSEVEGARCEKGEAFARQEAVEPQRVLTATVRCEADGRTVMVPVKTASPVPLVRSLEIMKAIKKLRLSHIPALGERIRPEEMPVPVELIITGE
jgi:CxxC motif-containing protein